MGKRCEPNDAFAKGEIALNLAAKVPIARRLTTYVLPESFKPVRCMSRLNGAGTRFCRDSLHFLTIYPAGLAQKSAVDDFAHQVDAGRWDRRDPRSVGASMLSQK